MISARRWRPRLAVIGVLLLGLGLVAAPAQARPVHAVAAMATVESDGFTAHYAVDEPACVQPADPSAYRCFAERRVDVSKGAPGAREYLTPNALPTGPAGGYTPNDLAVAYGYNPNLDRSSQLIGIIDWFDDPYALSDLNTFDTHYGLARETATSFRKVNQDGQTAPLPAANKGTSTEIALDVESARAVCHTCRILLVEADSGTAANLAAAEDRAAAMGATEISNSFGSAEDTTSKTILDAYNHAGIVITASTGDDGWFSWDDVNRSGGSSDDASWFPSSDPAVVSVGGTSLLLNADATRMAETVWNDNGPEDSTFDSSGTSGAGGGGCSTIYSAQAWQSAEAGYAAADCHGKRLAADISGIADPLHGFDILDSSLGGWATVGGTSLAAPVIAALYALAGGAGGARFPASSLYVNANRSPSEAFDVTEGGNGFCDGDTTANCSTVTFTDSGGKTHNPNALLGQDMDCSFPRNTSDVTTAPPESDECNARAGYDGPTGLGTPNSDALFVSTAPTLTLTRPASLRLNVSEAFTAKATEHLGGVQLSGYVWNWGDGTKRTDFSTAAAVVDHHTYTHAGTYKITLTVTDSTGQQAFRATTITVGRPASVHFARPVSVLVHHADHFNVHGTTDPNTGATITKVTWKWGDGRTTAESSVTASLTHTYATTGTKTITIVILDSTGVTTTVTKRVRVES